MHLRELEIYSFWEENAVFPGWSWSVDAYFVEHGETIFDFLMAEVRPELTIDDVGKGLKSRSFQPVEGFFDKQPTWRRLRAPILTFLFRRRGVASVEVSSAMLTQSSIATG